MPVGWVSVLLGHSSIKVTKKHYTSWVRARQEQLEADVRRSWILRFRIVPGVQTEQKPAVSKEALETKCSSLWHPQALPSFECGGSERASRQLHSGCSGGRLCPAAS